MRGLVILLILSLVVVGVTPGAEAQSEIPLLLKTEQDIRNLTKVGSGTSASPYIIDGLSFTAPSSVPITIYGTTKYVVLRNPVVAAAQSSDAIRIVNAAHVVVEGANLEFNKVGIRVVNSTDVTIKDSEIRASTDAGILLDSTSKAQILRNKIAVNGRDVVFAVNGTRLATQNVFRDNNLSISTDQTGFAFESPAMYDQDIDPSNVVNFIPMRWHVNLKGTAAAPKTISDEVVDVKGITNVAQVVCYNCSYVTIDRVTGTTGKASGLLIERSGNITISQIFAEGNEGSGIHVRNSSRIDVGSSNIYGNGIGFQTMNATHVNLTASQIKGSTRTGASLQYGGNVSLRGNTIAEGTGDGVAFDKVNGSLSEGNTIQDNSGDGVEVSASTSPIVRDDSLLDNGGAGVHLTSTTSRASVSNIRASGNAQGILLSKGTLLSTISSSVFEGNTQSGVALSSAGLKNTIADNTFADQPRHVELTLSKLNVFTGNRITIAPGEMGFWFDKEDSYDNEIPTSNTVNGTAMQWHVAIAGTPQSPMVLRDIVVETPNMTNVAQVMIYKGSYIDLVNTVASNGVRGVYTLRSSSMEIDGAQLTNNSVGLDMLGTQTAVVRGVTTYGGTSSVYLSNALNVTLADIAGPGTDYVVDIDKTSRGSIIEQIDATDVLKGSIRGASTSHLIADAGLDKLVALGNETSFDGTLAYTRFDSERIVRQTWDFGDGESDESGDTAALRPTHNYTTPGNYTATYKLQTADGRTLTDTVKVRIVPPPEMPAMPGVEANKSNGTVTLNWTPPASEFPIKSYRVYRGLNASNLTLLLETVNNATTTKEKFDTSMDVFYAITAVSFGGESALSEPFMLNITPPPPPPKPTPSPTEPTEPTEEAPTEGAKTPGPGFALALLAAAGVAVARQRRR